MPPFPVLLGFLYCVRQPPYKRVIRHLSGHIVQKCLQFLAYVIQAAVCIQEYFCSLIYTSSRTLFASASGLIPFCSSGYSMRSISIPGSILWSSPLHSIGNAKVFPSGIHVYLFFHFFHLLRLHSLLVYHIFVHFCTNGIKS